VFIVVNLVQMSECCVQSSLVVEERDGHVEISGADQSKRAELSGRRVLASDVLQTITRIRSQVEECSPDSLNEVFALMSVSVSASPLTLDLDDR